MTTLWDKLTKEIGKKYDEVGELRRQHILKCPKGENTFEAYVGIDGMLGGGLVVFEKGQGFTKEEMVIDHDQAEALMNWLEKLFKPST